MQEACSLVEGLLVAPLSDPTNFYRLPWQAAIGAAPAVLGKAEGGMSQLCWSKAYPLQLCSCRLPSGGT